jgi:hypothetical protein
MRTVSTRLNDNEVRKIVARAGGKTVSEYVREVVLNDLDKAAGDDKQECSLTELKAELGQIEQAVSEHGVLAKMIEREGWQSEQKDHAKSIEERLFDVEIFLKEFARAATGKERYALMEKDSQEARMKIRGEQYR